MQRIEAFLEDGFAGWGEAQNVQCSPAYADAAATPSATLTIATGEEALGSVRWRDLLQGAARSSYPTSLTPTESLRRWWQLVGRTRSK